MVAQSKIAERLEAFAKLYEHMAEETSSEIAAMELRKRAQRCRGTFQH